ncbi:MAG: copper chaperone PCu(A)C, partial [Hyphomicrobiaceae bacterium]
HIALVASLLAAVTISLPALSADVQKGPIKIEQPWTRATPGGAKVAGGFLKITNTGTTADRLVSATTDISGVVEFHEMKMVDGIMKMRALGSGIELAPGKTVELKPGGYHIMFVDLKKPLVKGKPIKAKLAFEKAGEVEVEFAVAPIGAKSPSGGGGHDHHKH